MNWRIVPALLALLAPFDVLADIGYVPGQATNQLCRQAIAAAERAHGIPAHLLAAIARVESGRRDQASGRFNPWPWTTNVDGVGAFYETKAQAVAASVSIRPKVVRSIDVGCMQISLTYHPDAFSSMDQAFDPASNAEYGARFLSQLFEKDGFLAAGGRTLSFRHAGPGPRLSAQGLCQSSRGTKARGRCPAPCTRQRMGGDHQTSTPINGHEQQSAAIDAFAAKRAAYNRTGIEFAGWIHTRQIARLLSIDAGTHRVPSTVARGWPFGYSRLGCPGLG